jgi:thiosulfate reductase cytochrome b subunit
MRSAQRQPLGAAPRWPRVTAWRRPLLLATVALVALGSLSSAYPGDDGYTLPRPVRETRCFTCHESWSPPLVEMARIVPPPTIGGAPGDSFDYPVQVQSAWAAAKGPTIIRMNACLDISNAAGLVFSGGPSGTAENETQLAIAYDVTRANEPQARRGTIPVPAGASGITFLAVPEDAHPATGPDLTLIVAPPGMNETRVNDAGPGAVENLTFTTEQLERLPPGNWTVGAEVPPLLDPANPATARPPAGSPEIRFRIVELIQFDAGKLRRLCQLVEEDLQKGRSTLVTWHLTVAGPPAPGSANITVDTTSYYEHTTLAPDFGNVTQSVVVPYEVEDARGLLVHEATPIKATLFVNGPTWVTVSEAVGYAATFLLVSSIVSGGMFGQASKRAMGRMFGSARRRINFHNFLSYGIIAASLFHMAVFLFRITEAYHWTLGLIWGGLAILCMFGLGVTGAFQVHLVRAWGFPGWRWTHFGLSVATILFTILHLLLDGVHFGFVQEWIDWRNPLDPGARVPAA